MTPREMQTAVREAHDMLHRFAPDLSDLIARLELVIRYFDGAVRATEIQELLAEVLGVCNQ